jgi:hypothetical protein
MLRVRRVREQDGLHHLAGVIGHFDDGLLAEVRHLAQEFPRHPLGFRQRSRTTWEFHTL